MSKNQKKRQQERKLSSIECSKAALLLLCKQYNQMGEQLKILGDAIYSMDGKPIFVPPKPETSDE